MATENQKLLTLETHPGLFEVDKTMSNFVGCISTMLEQEAMNAKNSREFCKEHMHKLLHISPISKAETRPMELCTAWATALLFHVHHGIIPTAT